MADQVSKEVQQEYRYTVSLNYINGSEENRLPSERISYLVLDYDYDSKNMPIIFISISIRKDIADHMILNDKKNYVTLEINKVMKKFSYTDSGKNIYKIDSSILCHKIQTIQRM